MVCKSYWIRVSESDGENIYSAFGNTHSANENIHSESGKIHSVWAKSENIYSACQLGGNIYSAPIFAGTNIRKNAPINIFGFIKIDKYVRSKI